MISKSTYKPKSLITCSSWAATHDNHESQYVLDVLRSGRLTQGKYVGKLEEAFAERCQARYALACGSGTAALHLAMLAQYADRTLTVVVPALTYVATANAAKYCGADVRFADVYRNDWTIDLSSALRAIGSTAQRALIVETDLYDSPAYIDPSSRVLLDAAHSAPKPLPSAVSVACYSFFSSKIIGCGEGGILVTNNESIYNLAKLYRGQGAPIPGQYVHDVVGYNYRMSELQAVVALAQFEELDINLQYRRHIVDWYRANLANSPITLQGGERGDGWMMAVLVPQWAEERPGFYRNKVRKALYDLNIETRPFFTPLPDLKPYYDPSCDIPVARSVASRGICLPTHVNMDDDDVDYICEKLIEVVTQ